MGEGGINRRRVAAAIARLAAMAAACAIAVACAPSPAPQPAPAPVVKETPAAQPTDRGGPPPHFPTGHAAYDITAIGLVSDPNDTTGRRDTVITSTTLAYDAHLAGSQLAVSGEIMSRVASTASPASRGDTTRGTRTTFRAMVDTTSGVVTIAPDSGAPVAPCVAGGDPSVDQARKLATTRPKTFSASATWHEVVSDTSCLGGLPLVSRSTRDFTVAAQSGADPITGAQSVMVSHTSTTTMAGSGHRAGHYITLYGSGSGTTQEYYDRRTGVLLSAHTVATLDLDITLSGHVQHLHQQADWRARIRPASR